MIWVLAVLLGLAAPLAQAADAQALFARMHQAGRSLDYEGTFVYQHGDQLESLRIIHKAGTGGVRERLVSLNGAPREIIRTDSEVRCYLPDENAVLTEHRRADNRNFPALLHDSLALLKGNYMIRSGKEVRAAGRKAVSVRIKPRDAYRYGYLLWVDEASGLLLKASLLDEQGEVIEQYMFTQVSIGGPIPESGASAIVYRRKQLGARPMGRLFHHVCRPVAQPHTRGAFLFGLRLMGIDGSMEDVPDTPENARVFGRHHSDLGQSAFPQVQGVYLVECGSHAIVDAGFWPYRTSERVGGYRLLRSVEPDMLVMWDRGLHSFDMVVGVVKRGGHVLSRLPARVKPERVRTLPDGSYLAYLYPSNYKRRKAGEHILVRVIEYTLTDPASGI